MADEGKKNMNLYLDSEVETMPVDMLRQTQHQKLLDVLYRVQKRNAFYQDLYRKHWIRLEDIKSVDDIVKLPFVRKSDFIQDQEKNPPFGTNLSEPLENYIRYHQTTGTTGKPLKWLDTERSWQWRGKCAAMALWAAGVRSSDIVFFPFAFGPHVAFWGLFEGARQIGALAIAGGGWNTLQRLESILENEVTVICCTPTYALRMAERAKEEGIEIRESSVRIMIHGGEPGALVPSIRKKIQEAWRAPAYDYTGLTEVGGYGFQCQHQDNAIHVNEGEFIIEVINPKTGDPLPDGQIGEMVLTNLGRSCSPAIRFRTGDLVKLKRDSCSCGRTYALLEGGVLGRADDMIVVRGMNIFPSKICEIVDSCLVVGDEYQVIAYTKDGMGELKVILELNESRDEDQVCRTVRETIRKRLEIRVEVEVVPRGTIPRSDYKSKRFVDKRERTL